MSVRSCVSCLFVAVLLAGCGSTTEGRSVSEPEPAVTPRATIDKAALIRRVEAACRRGLERWSDPRAVARDMPESPIQTTAPAEERRLAETLRGYRAIIQTVIDAVERLPQHDRGASAEKYLVALSRATTELEGDELKIRQQWNRELQAPAVRRYLRQARGLAKPSGFGGCARFPGKL